MDHHSIFDSGHPEPNGPPLKTDESGVPPEAKKLRFPGDDAGESLAQMAQRDLAATLQLLADRAQYITGASGSAIALREGSAMICRARAGPSAPELGAQLQVNSGLTAESVQTQQILRCDDSETDSRVNRESCRALGIASVMVMPLVREQEVIGVFELLSGRAYAFEERDITALQRLSEMILTALEHAEAAKRAEKEIVGAVIPAEANESEAKPKLGIVVAKEEAAPAGSPLEISQTTVLKPGNEERSQPNQAAVSSNIRKCMACGFPVSEGRILCLDCEAAQDASGRPGIDPAFLSLARAQQGWFAAHKYLLVSLLLTAITIAIVVWRH